MGADLIGYFAKGPRKLPKRDIPGAIAEADRRLAWLRKARPIVETQPPAAVIDLLEDCPWLDPKQLKRKVDEVDWIQLRDNIAYLLNTAGDIEDLTGEKLVRQFIQDWPPEFRDSAHIVDPDCPRKLIVFAGERTWGDPPEGAGFKLLSQAGILGIAPILGVWVEAAFISIRIPSILKGNQHDD